MGSHQKRVAVIGAGVSGVTSAKHLKGAGIEVVVFERSRQAGGNWVYDERKPLEPSYPSITPSIADFIIEKDQKGNVVVNGVNAINGSEGYSSEDEELRFAPPGPAYSGLTNNVSTKLQQLKGFPWKEETPDFVNVRQKQEYIQSYSKYFGVEPLVRYNTRVEKLQKVDGRWKLNSATWIKDGSSKGKRVNEVEEFDSVVVASGHYHSPNVPDIPGLKEWKRKWPERVSHSKTYRTPDEFKDKTVLLIGAGVSSMDIGREASHIAKKIYQSSRGGPFDIPVVMLSPETERVAGIASLNLPSDNDTSGTVTLVNGTVLTGIDRVVIATGYLFTLPFLLDLHDDSITPTEANDTVLITNGTQMHNLHKDIFYIPDPTLAFVGIPFYTATFSFFEFQAIAVAYVFSGRAWLPSKEAMQAEYTERVERKGSGRALHDLKGTSIQYVDELVGWLNEQAETTGARKVEGYSEEWQAEAKLIAEKYVKRVQTQDA
ncbi:FAD/NAD(P)-binding domain-containing protein [Stipitochalara longipes BDJ]|nr:FAD/NAD(P)-binding domain-containing protein [Stipitochalara longipes BDJ]